MAILTDPVIEEALLPQLDALMSAHYLEIACFTLLVYDYAITFGQEVQYFWRGAWTLSRILFLLNRYIPLCVMTSLTVVFFGTGFSVQVCTYATRAVFFLSIVAICINQAILLLRVWYMFPYSPLLRTIASSSFIACTLASLFLTGSNIHGLYSIQPPWGPDVPIPGCSAPPASGIWKSFVPTTVVHSVLYALTVVRAAKQPWGVPRARLLMRLVREGGLVYFVAMVSAIFSAVGARLTAVPSINYPAYSKYERSSVYIGSLTWTFKQPNTRSKRSVCLPSHALRQIPRGQTSNRPPMAPQPHRAEQSELADRLRGWDTGA
ncbi:hypothetical protein HYDPIDRAFT_111150 [Hydnomerulius pinastri MD-312]|uniref:DUF6533 domain-containing protein n=1 Tax=Hydnomerulius pinastri MD-312 TaxID=994086 RepID=A0A0C9VHV3_9AGAM|nr:hypothetical protein HYDPIDRAFT_111150 [Hydnomerulius pinastri MD-312]